MEVKASNPHIIHLSTSVVEPAKQIPNKVNKPWLFQPGQSGNPKGRPPKGYSVADVWRRLFADKTDKRDALADKVYSLAMGGDLNAAKLIVQYMDGMPTQTQELTGRDGEPLVPLPILGGAKSHE